jgi:hypothetical protein
MASLSRLDARRRAGQSCAAFPSSSARSARLRASDDVTGYRNRLVHRQAGSLHSQRRPSTTKNQDGVLCFAGHSPPLTGLRIAALRSLRIESSALRWLRNAVYEPSCWQGLAPTRMEAPTSPRSDHNGICLVPREMSFAVVSCVSAPMPRGAAHVIGCVPE